MDMNTNDAPAASPAPVYDDTRMYEVTLNRVVEWPAGSGHYYKPIHGQQMMGWVCKEIADGIGNAKPL